MMKVIFQKNFTILNFSSFFHFNDFYVIFYLEKKDEDHNNDVLPEDRESDINPHQEISFSDESDLESDSSSDEDYDDEDIFSAADWQNDAMFNTKATK